MLILGIESTCDETAAAIVKDGREILSNVISSQIDLQTVYGGVVPELACRRHIDVIDRVIEEALSKAQVSWEEIDGIAVAHGPGLIGAILVGLNAAKGLAWSLNKPLFGINHIEAHLYATLMSTEGPIPFPCLGAVLSGGHTSLVKVSSVGNYIPIAHTVDDAIGEAYDKVARLLDLPYPGGPEIEKLAKNGNPNRYPFRAGRVKGHPLNFSFSGLKTAVLYTVKGNGANKKSPSLISVEDKADVAASFQETALDDIVAKTLQAASEQGCKAIILGGGVTQNRKLREKLNQASALPVFWPGPGMSLDNAAMIAGLAYHRACEQANGDALSLDAATRLSFAQTL